MSDIAASSFVRQELVPERIAPVKTTGFVGFVRTRLLNSPTNILLTIVSILLLWFTVVPAVKFLLIDAVWSGTDRNACLAENAGHTVGACWPYIQAKFSQFVYGFYPDPERWRVNLTFILAAVLLLPLASEAQEQDKAKDQGQSSPLPSDSQTTNAIAAARITAGTKYADTTSASL